ncbi:MAG: S8 family serine peptidase [Sphingobium sp.]|uniref:S8 family serine peptidase n=1 Tax=Sphingobium sp. TaxID=1912891 RepID=UPI0029B324EB|nr:S8 family serine peptidase [Sphingobium sp.]MDX3910408.1 S8 family serine peptidase [Sphingobium sp.]
MHRHHFPILLLALLVPGWAAAQQGLGSALRQGVGGVIDGLTDLVPLERISPVQAARDLAAARIDRLSAFVRQNREAIAFDDRGNPSVRGIVLVAGAPDEAISAIRSAGYGVEQDSIEGLDIAFARVTLPAGTDLSKAMQHIRKLAPGAEVSADTVYFASGLTPANNGKLAGAGPAGIGAIGLIDGGVAAHPVLSGRIEQRGFAKGAPMPSSHGTAVASLIVGKGETTGSAPGAPLLVADIYGNDKAGGGALAIARALGWMASRRVSIVTVSLVGPANPLLGRAVDQALSRGMRIVAAVGNDGPAAPPPYPASYLGVIAVTGVDGRNRVLIEAGRPKHLDYAAPGADMRAARATGGVMRVRGTSFAAPLVAGRLYQLRNVPKPLSALDAEAIDLGAKGPDTVFGRGLICGKCRNRL